MNFPGCKIDKTTARVVLPPQGESVTESLTTEGRAVGSWYYKRRDKSSLLEKTVFCPALVGIRYRKLGQLL